jgi:hypothetical protein
MKACTTIQFIYSQQKMLIQNYKKQARGGGGVGLQRRGKYLSYITIFLLFASMNRIMASHDFNMGNIYNMWAEQLTYINTYKISTVRTASSNTSKNPVLGIRTQPPGAEFFPSGRDMNPDPSQTITRLVQNLVQHTQIFQESKMLFAKLRTGWRRFNSPYSTLQDPNPV